MYKDAYKNLDGRIVALTRSLIFEKKFYRQSDSEKLRLMNWWLKKASEIYGIPVPKLEISNSCGSGCYSLLRKKIYLPKFSLVTLFHEFKHHMQEMKNKPNTENIARGWSVSLFYQASPEHYENAVRKKLLIYQ